MLISDKGTLVRTRVAEVSQLGRNTQGVTLIRLPADETLVSVMRLEAEEGNADESGEGEASAGDAGPVGELPVGDE
jgi:DNA gyrase subunit A